MFLLYLALSHFRTLKFVKVSEYAIYAVNQITHLIFRFQTVSSWCTCHLLFDSVPNIGPLIPRWELLEELLKQKL